MTDCDQEVFLIVENLCLGGLRVDQKADFDVALDLGHHKRSGFSYSLRGG
jgi:hypothetical protein